MDLADCPRTDYPPYVSESPAPDGVKGIYTYLGKEVKIQEWTSAPDLLPKTMKHQLLIMIEPSISIEKEEWAAYKQYMQAGNTILLLQTNPKHLFGLKTKKVSSNEGKIVFDQNHTAFKADTPSVFRLKDKRKDEVLLSDQYGTIAMKRPLVKGQLIVATTPNWLTNDRILKNNHLELLVKLINESHATSILFDEFIHGAAEPKSQMEALPKWFVILMFQSGLLLLLLLWYQGKRFGPIFVSREETVRFSDEGLRALSAWYLRGQRFHDSLVIQAEYVKLLLQEKWHIPYSKEWPEIDHYLERRKVNMPDIHGFLSGLSTVLAKEKVGKQEYLLWSRKLDQLRKEVEE